MSNDVFIGLAATITGPALMFGGFRALRLHRLIENTPTVKVRSMAMGLVELKGRVEARSSTTAPFSGKPCAYWEVDISSQGRRNTWTTVHRNRSGSPFYVSDETGLALVMPQGLDARLPATDSEVCSGLNLPGVYADYLREHRTRLGPFARLSTLRFRERRVEEGAVVYLLGTAAPRARVTAVNDEEAFLATGTDDPAAVALRARRVRSRDAEVVATIRRGEHAPVFFMSHESEGALRFGLSLQWKLMLAGGPLVTAFGLWCLLSMIPGAKP